MRWDKLLFLRVFTSVCATPHAAFLQHNPEILSLCFIFRHQLWNYVGKIPFFYSNLSNFSCQKNVQLRGYVSFVSLSPGSTGGTRWALNASERKVSGFGKRKENLYVWNNPSFIGVLTVTVSKLSVISRWKFLAFRRPVASAY